MSKPRGAMSVYRKAISSLLIVCMVGISLLPGLGKANAGMGLVAESHADMSHGQADGMQLHAEPLAAGNAVAKGASGDGASGDGTASDGAASDGAASDGAASDGIAGDGTAGDGTSSDGIAGDGTAGDGASAGAMPNGGATAETAAGGDAASKAPEKAEAEAVPAAHEDGTAAQEGVPAALEEGPGAMHATTDEEPGAVPAAPDKEPTAPAVDGAPPAPGEAQGEEAPDSAPDATADGGGGIAGFLWVDGNGSLPTDWDGLRNGAERPLAGYTVSLYAVGSLAKPLAQTHTGSDGAYAFTGLAPGSYVAGLASGMLNGTEYLLPMNATADNKIVIDWGSSPLRAYSASISIAGGEQITGISAGMRLPMGIKPLATKYGVYADLDKALVKERVWIDGIEFVVLKKQNSNGKDYALLMRTGTGDNVSRPFNANKTVPSDKYEGSDLQNRLTDLYKNTNWPTLRQIAVKPNLGSFDDQKAISVPTGTPAKNVATGKDILFALSLADVEGLRVSNVNGLVAQLKIYFPILNTRGWMRTPVKDESKTIRAYAWNVQANSIDAGIVPFATNNVYDIPAVWVSMDPFELEFNIFHVVKGSSTTYIGTNKKVTIEDGNNLSYAAPNIPGYTYADEWQEGSTAGTIKKGPVFLSKPTQGKAIYLLYNVYTPPTTKYTVSIKYIDKSNGKAIDMPISPTEFTVDSGKQFAFDGKDIPTIPGYTFADEWKQGSASGAANKPPISIPSVSSSTTIYLYYDPIIEETFIDAEKSARIGGKATDNGSEAKPVAVQIGDAITYEISVFESVGTVSDTVPEGLAVDEGSISDGGMAVPIEGLGTVVTWFISGQKEAPFKLSFKATVDKPGLYKNTAFIDPLGRATYSTNATYHEVVSFVTVRYIDSATGEEIGSRAPDSHMVKHGSDFTLTLGDVPKIGGYAFSGGWSLANDADAMQPLPVSNLDMKSDKTVYLFYEPVGTGEKNARVNNGKIQNGSESNPVKVKVGDTITYEIQVSDGVLSISDPIPDGLDIMAKSHGASGDDNTVIWFGDIVSGDTVTVETKVAKAGRFDNEALITTITPKMDYEMHTSNKTYHVVAVDVAVHYIDKRSGEQIRTPDTQLVEFDKGFSLGAAPAIDGYVFADKWAEGSPDAAKLPPPVSLPASNEDRAVYLFYEPDGLSATMVDVSIEKTVVGDYANDKQIFPFLVYFAKHADEHLPKDTEFLFEGEAIAGTGAEAPGGGKLVLDEDGKAEFALSHGQRIVIKDVPVGLMVGVVEEEGYGYSVSFIDSKTPGAPVTSNDTGLRKIEAGQGNRSFAFLNELDSVPPMGIGSGSWTNVALPLVAILIIFAGVAVTKLVKHRTAVF